MRIEETLWMESEGRDWKYTCVERLRRVDPGYRSFCVIADIMERLSDLI